MKNLKKLTTMAILIAISIVLVSLIHFPIFPAVAFLEYDPADISILICGFAFGPLAGLIVTAAAALLQGITVSASGGIYGIIMHLLATGALVGTSAAVYSRNKTKKGAEVSILCGILAMALVMIPANLFVTPYFMGVDRSVVVSLLPFIILFNLLKATINGIITFFVYKKISRHLQKLSVK